MLPTVGSQSYVTVTTQVSRTQTGLITLSSTVSVLQRQLVFNQSFTVYSTTGTSLSCETINFPFNATRGEYISGTIKSNIEIDFYIMTDANYRSFSTLGNCGSVPAAIEARQNTMNHTFNVALPDSEVWDIVLVNSSNTRNASGFLSAYLISGTSVSTAPLLRTLTRTKITRSTIIMQATFPNLSAYSLIAILGIFVIVFVIVTITIRKILRRRQST